MITKFNLSQTDTNKSVYRVFNLDFLLDAICSRKNTLVNIKKWDDPFDNNVMELDRIDIHGMPQKYIFGGYLGQCWTFNPENDFMWRAYSEGKENIIVKSSLQKLIDSLEKSAEYNETETDTNKFNEKYADADRPEAEFFSYIGKIKYLSEHELIKLNKSRKFGELSNSFPLLHKRKEFRHEKEVRLVINYWNLHYDVQDIWGDFYKYSIDPNFLFEELVFDPRMNTNKYLACKNYLTSIGYHNQIAQSNLYNLPFKSINI